MKRILLIISLLAITFANASAYKTIHDFKATTIDGYTLDFSTFEGKKLMIVNTASKCGYTYQYAGLQSLYSTYSKQYDFEIIGFPANNFNGQEPGSDESIDDFCTQNYGVTFQMMSKISVKGADQHPIYSWLTKKAQNGVLDSEVQWNFQKYFINRDGTFYGVVGTQVEPNDPAIIEWVSETSGIIENSLEINIYPNPTSEILNIEHPEMNFQNAEFSLYNAAGQICKIIKSRTTNISDLPAGVYFIKIKSNDFEIVKKVIKN